MPAKIAKVDCYVRTIRITIPVAPPSSYDAARKSLDAIKVENGTIVVLSEGLQRVPAKEVGK